MPLTIMPSRFALPEKVHSRRKMPEGKTRDNPPIRDRNKLRAPSAQSANRPGGGLGPPIDAPDPLQKYRWYILGGFAAVLIAGAVFVASRQQSAARAATRGKSSRVVDYLDDNEYADAEAGKELTQVPAAQIPPPKPRTIGAAKPMLLEALKEELFDLEVEHKQGGISDAEYEKAKSALDQTLERALKREAQKNA